MVVVEARGSEEAAKEPPSSWAAGAFVPSASLGTLSDQAQAPGFLLAPLVLRQQSCLAVLGATSEQNLLQAKH